MNLTFKIIARICLRLSLQLAYFSFLSLLVSLCIGRIVDNLGSALEISAVVTLPIIVCTVFCSFVYAIFLALKSILNYRFGHFSLVVCPHGTEPMFDTNGMPMNPASPFGAAFGGYNLKTGKPIQTPPPLV